MESFTKLTGVAAPLPMINVDTDMIIPKQFLKTIKRSGLGKSLFFELRYDDVGNEHTDFVLNGHHHRDAKILIAGDNFGCGSSREHAPWALLDFGIRCVIAPSFADIFFNNCFKNGILPVVLPRDRVDQLMAEVAHVDNATLTVDLDAQEITMADGRRLAFDVDPFRKECLLDGVDEIGLTLKEVHKVDAFEERQRVEQPWLYA